jgi:predicted RND superfamily exporter protein
LSFPSVWLPGLARRPRAVIAVGLLLMVALGVGAYRVRYDHNLLNLQAESLESVRWERSLLKHTAGASWHALTYTESPELAIQMKESFEKLPTVSRVVEIASLVPGRQEEKFPLMREIRARLDGLPEGQTPEPLPSSPDSLLASVEQLAGVKGAARKRESSSPDAAVFAGLREDMTRLAHRLRQLTPATAGGRLHQFECRLSADLCANLHRLRDVSNPKTIELADLPASLRERYVSPNGRWLLRIFGRDSLWEYQPLSDFVADVSSVDPEATGKPFTTLEGLRAMQRGFLWAGLYALLAIIVVLYLDFRAVRPVLLALAPLLIGVMLTMGVLGFVGCALNPANMIALPLIVGVGVDNGVHVLHDYLSRRRGSGPYLLSKSTGMGILVAGLTTILGFGALMLSSHRGLAGLGLILALGVTFSLLASLVFLPAVLNLSSRTWPTTPVAEAEEEPEELRRAA